MMCLANFTVLSTISYFAPNARPTEAPIARRHRLSAGAIAGMSIGAVFGGICILALILLPFLRRRRQRMGTADPGAPTRDPTQDGPTTHARFDKPGVTTELQGNYHAPSMVHRPSNQSGAGRLAVELHAKPAFEAPTSAFYVPYRPPPQSPRDGYLGAERSPTPGSATTIRGDLRSETSSSRSGLNKASWNTSRLSADTPGSFSPGPELFMEHN